MHGFETICYTHGFEETKNSWSSANAFLSGVGGQKFKSRTGQIERSVANDSPPLRYFFERSCVANDGGRNDAEMGPANSFHASAYYIEYNERFDFMHGSEAICLVHKM